jgi:hypothetical protein
MQQRQLTGARGIVCGGNHLGYWAREAAGGRRQCDLMAAAVQPVVVGRQCSTGA